MNDSTGTTSPDEARREGLAELEHQPHHATTQRDKPAHPRTAEPEQTPSEKHRDGMLPNIKK